MQIVQRLELGPRGSAADIATKGMPVNMQIGFVTKSEQ
jgi:hypothetical protein